MNDNHDVFLSFNIKFMDRFLVIPEDVLFNILSRTDTPELQALWDTSPQRQFLHRRDFMTEYNAERQRRRMSAWIVTHRWNRDDLEDQWVHATRESDGLQINSRLPFFGNHLRFQTPLHLVGVVESNVIFFCENERFCIWNLLTNKGEVIAHPHHMNVEVDDVILGTRVTRIFGRLAFVYNLVHDVQHSYPRSRISSLTSD